jgi:hypothetical protein
MQGKDKTEEERHKQITDERKEKEKIRQGRDR